LARWTASDPIGLEGGEVYSKGIDAFQNYNPNALQYNELKKNLPHVIFRPNRGK
jgi:hypothetical protein